MLAFIFFLVTFRKILVPVIMLVIHLLFTFFVWAQTYRIGLHGLHITTLVFISGVDILILFLLLKLNVKI
jgi:hypothetical protein